MTNDMLDPKPSATRRIPLVIATVAIGGLAGFGVLYGLGLSRAPAGDPACRAAVATASRIAPLARGEGKPKKLSDFRGKTLLVNLWATWCVPCRKEMPALDALQAKLAGPNFEVVAINIDTRDPEKPKNFLKDASLTRLGYFNDQKAKVFQDLKAIGRALGMPTSVLVDPQGCEIATIAGPAEWASDDALKLIRATLGPAAAAL
jgi:thiol-disulfide isomerase/thioredoxin